MNIQVTGYWTFFCNPSKWEIDKFLEWDNEYDTYQVTKWQEGYFSPGQLGVIRVGRDTRTKKQLNGRKKLESGVYAIIEVLSNVHIRENEPSDKYWVNWTEDEMDKKVVDIRYLKNLLNSPIYLNQIKDEDIEEKYLISGFQASTMPLQKSAFNKLLIMAGGDKILGNIESSNVDLLEDIIALEQKYKNAVPEVKEIISTRIERGNISEKVKQISGRKCLVCETLGLNPYTFKKKNQECYIEAHHVIPVYQLAVGSLSLSNIVTLCPNHHRQFHYGNVEMIANDRYKFIFKIDNNVVEIHKVKI